MAQYFFIDIPLKLGKNDNNGLSWLNVEAAKGRK
jgi:hypothetical protein